MKQLKYGVLPLAGLMLASCNLMHDDLPDCAVAPEVSTCVRFQYDYNGEGTDLFSRDVGSVSLYLFDEEGGFIARHDRDNVSSGDALKEKDFKIDLELEPGNYKVYATARGNQGGENAAYDLPGAKFRVSDLKSGDGLENLYISLDNHNGVVDNAHVMLDTLWTTLKVQELHVPRPTIPQEGDPQEADVEVTAVVSLMRVTNHVEISFIQTDFPGSIDPEDYDVAIESSEGRDRMDIFGNYIQGSCPLVFSPFKQNAGTDESGKMKVQTEFGLPRFMMRSDANQRPMLRIKNRNTGNETGIDFLAILDQAQKELMKEKGWEAQEYFDRNYDFSLFLALNDETWKYAVVSINALSWSKRIQNEDF